jgi:uncharacterized protein YecE (DUF72 family)
MEFGRVKDVDVVDFSFPEDHKDTTEILAQNKSKIVKPEIYIGCAKWGRKDWVGQLYPKGTKEVDFLKHYVQHFNSIELNALFYRLFPKSTVEKWASTAQENFRFCPKFTNIITHLKRLENVDRETEALLETYSAFGKKLGTSFIQLDERFPPKQFEKVQRYLQSLPIDFDVAIEFRHPDWFKSIIEVEETYSLMKELNVTSVITDTAGRRDVMHARLTTPKAFVRFVGNSLHPSDYKRIDDWIERIDLWLQQGLQTLYFFIHQHDELYSPKLSAYMIEKINKRCGLQLSPPKLISNTLF